MKKNKLVFAVFAFLITTALFSAVQAADPQYTYLAEIEGTSFLPSTIYSGNLVSVAVDVRDRSLYHAIQDLKAVLALGNQFEGVVLEDSVDSINPGTAKTLIFQFRVKDGTLPGHYPVFLSLEYLRDKERISESQEIVIPVSKTEKNIDVTIAPSSISPGSQTELAFSLKNVSGNAVSNVSFYWTEENNLVLPLGSDNKRYVNVIEPNQSAEISYTVAADPNITTGIYPLDVTITFTDVNGVKTQASVVGMLVGGKTDFEVSAELAGGQLSVSIANIGSNNAGAVIVKLQGMAASGSNTAILGNLNKGDYTIAGFEVQPANGKTAAAERGFPGFDQASMSQEQMDAFRNRRANRAGLPDQNTELPFGRQLQSDQNAGQTPQEVVLLIEYTDTTGERQSVRKTIQLNSSASALTARVTTGTLSRQGDSSLIAWALLVLIVLAAIGFNKFRQKKKGKQLLKPIAVIVALFLAAIYLLESNIWAIVIAGIASIALLSAFFKGKVFVKEKK